MKKIIFSCAVLVSTFGFAQKSNELKTCEDQVSALTKENNYLKETLKLVESKPVSSANSMELRIVKAVGNRKDRSLQILFMYKNISNEIRRNFQGEKAQFIDPQGNSYLEYTVSVGSNNDVRIENLPPDIPAKGSVVFKNVEETPSIRLLTIFFFNGLNDLTGLSQKVNFENIPVVWQ